MSYDKVMQAKQISIGTKQTMKVVEQGKATEVYVAKDAEHKVTSKIVHLCNKMNVQVIYVDSMKQLGKACGIDVGAAVAACVNE